jgi:hypothetical protein
MVFLGHPERFATDRAKVIYAASYLTGIAADWFEPYTQDHPQNTDTLLDDWPTFESELHELYGDPDEEATNERALRALNMKENHRVGRYITSFRRYSSHVSWDDNALFSQFRLGLPDRILDALAQRENPPRTLSSLMDAALRLDNRFWERQSEKTSDNPKKPSDNSSANRNKSFGGSSGPYSKDSNKPPNTFGSKFKSSGSPNNSHSSGSNKFQDKTSDVGKKLDNTGKLKSSERQNRIDNNLCLYCGGSDHAIDTCPKRKARESQNCHVKTSSPSATSSSNGDALPALAGKE